MPRLLRVLLCLTLCLATTAGLARPRIGLVLGGGGARGFAHLAVLQTLEQLRIPIDCIAGTSAGALVGGSYASGMSLDALQASFAAQNWDYLLAGRPARAGLPFSRKVFDAENYLDITLGLKGRGLRMPKSAINSQAIDLYLKELTQGVSPTSFRELPIPFEAVATDLENGEAVVFKQGDLASALRASMAVPGVFAAVKFEDRLLVDGGLARNLPVENLKGQCADVIIAVDVGSPNLKAEEIENLFDVVAQTTNLAVGENAARSKALLGPADVLITPALGDFTSADFDQSAGIIERGRAAMQQDVLESLARYRVSEAEYAAWQQQRMARRQPPEVIHAIELGDTGYVPRAQVARHIQQSVDQPLDLLALHQQLAELYLTGDFEQLHYQLAGPKDARRLHIEPQTQSVGPHFLKIGSEFMTDLAGSTQFNLLLAYHGTWANRLGGEWRARLRLGYANRLEVEFLQPWAQASDWFVAPGVSLSSEPYGLFDGNGQHFADLVVERHQAGLDIGRQLGRLGEWRLGLWREQDRAHVSIGELQLPGASRETNTSLRASLLLDQFDNPRWPRQGYLLSARWMNARRNWDADRGFSLLESRADLAATRGRYTLRGTLQYHTTPGSQADPFHLFSLGGFLHLTGYQTHELIGERLLFARLMAYHKFANMPAALGSGVYAGLSAEAGRIWKPLIDNQNTRWIGAGSAFIGADSLLGPLFFGLGAADGGRPSAYVMLGMNY